MDTPFLSGLDGLSDIGLRGGVDMRPTLLRVLTDLYVQKLAHSAEEERHYTELALRLLDSVDVATRAAVAARLARHLAPPARVVQRLATDLPDVVAALKSQTPSQSSTAAVKAALGAATAASRAATALQSHRGSARSEESARPRKSTPITPATAVELNELFFAATADERRLILRNLHLVVGSPEPAPAAAAADPTTGRRLEAAALARRRQDFIQVLARALQVSRRQAQRIAHDELGEPILVAGKALGIKRDLLYRILLFVNSAVGHSVERVHALAEIYDEMSLQAAEDLTVIWQVAAPEREDGPVWSQPPRPTSDFGLRRSGSVQRRPASQRNDRRDAG